MTRGAVSLRPDTTRAVALSVFETHGLQRAPVMEDGVLRGIICESDLRGTSARIVAVEQDEGVQLDFVEQIMQTEVVTVSSTSPLMEAAALMVEHGINGLPVVDEGKVVGMITESDLYRAFVQSVKTGDMRLTFAIPSTEKKKIASKLDPVAVCLRLGLRIKGLYTHGGPHAREVTVMHVEGERCADLARLLSSAGFEILGVERISERPAA